MSNFTHAISVFRHMLDKDGLSNFTHASPIGTKFTKHNTRARVAQAVLFVIERRTAEEFCWGFEGDFLKRWTAISNTNPNLGDGYCCERNSLPGDHGDHGNHVMDRYLLNGR